MAMSRELYKGGGSEHPGRFGDIYSSGSYREPKATLVESGNDEGWLEVNKSLLEPIEP